MSGIRKEPNQAGVFAWLLTIVSPTTTATTLFDFPRIYLQEKPKGFKAFTTWFPRLFPIRKPTSSEAAQISSIVPDDLQLGEALHTLLFEASEMPS